MQPLNLSSRLHSEPLAIKLTALRDLVEKQQAYLAGRIEARVPGVTARIGIVGPIAWDGGPMIPQLEILHGIGIIRVQGALFRGVGWLDALFGAYDYEWLGCFLQQAVEDRAVDSIMLFIDSPGGSHVGMEETAALVAWARTLKPVRVFTNGDCCSAAYGIAVQATEIFASPSAIVGCLGSKLIALDSSDAYRLMGLRVEVFTAGAEGQDLPLKAMHEEGKPISEAERAFHRSTTQYSGRWVQSVIERRPQAKGVSFAGGWVFGSQALEDGLVDGNPHSLENLLAAILVAAN